MMKNNNFNLAGFSFTLTLLLFTMAFGSNKVFADVTLPYIFSDNMVLQRETPLKIWGWADAGERITVILGKQRKTTRADKEGSWNIKLDPLAAGGPYQLEIRGKNTFQFNNILIGDVWLGSGQSNMEWPLKSTENPTQAIQEANYPSIRLFTVPRNLSNKPVQNTQKAQWLECTPENVADFSAVGYYFSQILHQELSVPIGIINSSWGGTVAETWISAETMLKHNDFKVVMEKGPAINLDNIQERIDKKLTQWHADLDHRDLGLQENWHLAEYDDGSWDQMTLPGYWENLQIEELNTLDGIVWYRRAFYLNEQQASQSMELNLGFIDDSDFTYVNGILIGSIQDAYSENRNYNVPANALKAGRNIIAVRVIDTGGNGGFWGDHNQMYYISGNHKTALNGMWSYAIGARSIEASPQSVLNPNMFPTLLFNAMIHPLRNFSIRGVIWYQGESNTDRAYQYRSLFTSLIEDWRSVWSKPDLPFLFVQLANFMQADQQPTNSEWAELRESQSYALKLPNTAMAVTIDIGDANDIHPQNKYDVGKRLALAALHISYGKDIVFSGPIYQSMNVQDQQIHLHFTSIGSGLCAHDKYGYLKGFAIAGEDRVFHWAKAVIEGNTVVVFSEKVKNPVAVRYAWGNNPDDANLYNSEGLPASPFRTDEW